MIVTVRRTALVFSVLFMLMASIAITQSAATAATASSPTANAVVASRFAEVLDATGCTHNAFGTEQVCIHVQGVGLFVGAATVTNKHLPSGVAKILNTGSGTVHSGPAITAGQSWTYHFNRNLINGARVCGTVGNNSYACVTIHS